MGWRQARGRVKAEGIHLWGRRAGLEKKERGRQGGKEAGAGREARRKLPSTYEASFYPG